MYVYMYITMAERDKNFSSEQKVSEHKILSLENKFTIYKHTGDSVGPRLQWPSVNKNYFKTLLALN